MFTGIVQKTARVLEFSATSPQTYQLKINNPFEDEDPVKLGESIANNGVCLTVTAFTKDWMTFDLAPETVARTALKRLKSGSLVNLERSLRMGDRLSGHWVQGHVDGVVKVNGIHPTQNCYDLMVAFQDPALLKYCVKKGSISLDGISLTIHDIQGSVVQFQIIPHTWNQTALPDLKAGDLMNIEVDILAKYAENFKSFPSINN